MSRGGVEGDVVVGASLPDGAALIRPTITVQTPHYKHTNT